MELKKSAFFSRCGEQSPSLPEQDENQPATPGPGPEELPTPELTPEEGVQQPEDDSNLPEDDSQTPGSGDNAEILPSDSIDPALLSLAMGFVPRQAWETPYAFDVALRRGTIFPSLDKPFLGEEALPQ